MYTCRRKVTYSEISAHGHADGAQIIRYFQDCSTFQSEQLGVGMDFLEKHHHVWILTAWQVLFNRFPQLGETIEAGTWAYDFDVMYGYRNFILKDAHENELARANSLWVLVDTHTGKPVKITKEDVQAYACETRLEMDYAPRRIRLPKVWEQREPFRVTFKDLDTNQHVNNAQYISMILDQLDCTDDLHELRAEYKKQAVLGDIIYPKVCREDGRSYVALCDHQDHVFVAAEIKYR